MTRGQKIILLMIGGLIVISLIIYFVVVPIFPKKPVTNTNANVNTSALPVSGNENTNTAPVVIVPPPATVSTEAEQISAVRSVARTFAERLGTYTNQNNLVNLDDLQTFSTPAVWKYINGEYRDDLVKAMLPYKNYYSSVSSVISLGASAVSPEETSVTIGVQTVESGEANNATYKTLDLKLKKIDGAWVVSWLEWQK